MSTVVAPIDMIALHGWMRGALRDVGPHLDARVIAGGQSNPTYALEDGQRRWVLRKQPPGELLPSAHAIDREYRIQQALADSGVPVPRMTAYCDDRRVIGTPFYLMDWLDGRVMPDYALPQVPAAERAACYRAMAQTLARLHRVDWAAAGLADFGRPGNFFERQIARWSRQWEASAMGPDAGMDRLIAWLRANLPAGDETSIVHGDFRLGNLMFHPSEPRVIAVLDWELSTLGHPLADVAYSAMAWHMRPSEFGGLRGLDLGALGLPAQHEYFDAYLLESGGDGVLPFHLAFAMFRFAVILAGVAARARQGNAAAADAKQVGSLASAFAREALALI